MSSHPPRRRPGSRRVLLALAAIAFAAPPPMEVQPVEWPLERLVTNLEQRLRADPDDAEAHYTLGRALGFAFVLQRDSLWSVNKGTVTADLREQRERFGDRATAPVTPARSLERLSGGVFHLRRACELVVDARGSSHERWRHEWWSSRKHLTFAWLFETGASHAGQVATMEVLGVSPVPLAPDERALLERHVADLASDDLSVSAAAQAALATHSNLERALPLLCRQVSSPDARSGKAVAALLERYWNERAIAEYWLAFEQNIERDLSVAGWEIDRLVSLEALLGYDRLVRRRGVQSREEEGRLADISVKRKQLETHPSGEPITPMLFAMDACKTLDELVSLDLTVAFDLDGDGVDEIWPWIAPDAGWLVWDPQRRGEITSGRQLFGTASAWLFFENGYRVLDALDDDRSGRLEGGELTDIAVWFDLDTDGVSDRGEVVPVEELGITALATEATLQIGASPANLCGLELDDGRVLPTYDWVLAPVTE